MTVPFINVLAMHVSLTSYIIKKILPFSELHIWLTFHTRVWERKNVIPAKALSPLKQVLIKDVPSLCCLEFDETWSWLSISIFSLDN